MKRSRKIVSIAFLLSVLYVGSLGPAVGCLQAASWHEGPRLIEILYAPIFWFEPYCPAYVWNALGSYVEGSVDAIVATWPATPALTGSIAGAIAIRTVIRWRNRLDDPAAKRLTPGQ